MSVSEVRNSLHIKLLQEWVDSTKPRLASGPFGRNFEWECPCCKACSPPFTSASDMTSSKSTVMLIKHTAACLLLRSIRALNESATISNTSE